MNSTRPPCPRNRAATRGSTMVEAALVWIVFVVLLLAIADFGQFLFVQQAIVERARVAARWGAANNPANTTAIQNVLLYSQSATPQNPHPLFGLAASNIAVSLPDAGTDNYRLVVQVSGYTYRVLSPYLNRTYTGPTITVSFPLGRFNSNQ